MNIVDWVVVVALVLFAVAGWRRGFVAGVLSFAGFLGGGLIAAFLLPPILAATGLPDLVRGIAVAGGVLVFAIVGQVCASILGKGARGALSWQPARVLDNTGGAVLNVLALAVVTWIIASAIAYLPSSSVSQQLSDSRVLTALDSLVPPPVRNAFGSLRDLVGATAVPRIFSGFAQITGPDVAAPDVATDTSVLALARESIVKITGDTPECGNTVSGSGFAFGTDRVITNAHVVAGVRTPIVRVRAGDPPLPASVVYFDPQTDVAVLDVPGLGARPLLMADATAASGDSAVVAGFPESGPFRAEPARIRTVVDARGDDIYGHAGVDRQVYVLRGLVLPGNSGGPLLDPEGRALGLVFGADQQVQTTGYALTADQLRPAIQTSVALTEPVDTGTCRLRE